MLPITRPFRISWDHLLLSWRSSDEYLFLSKLRTVLKQTCRPCFQWAVFPTPNPCWSLRYLCTRKQNRLFSNVFLFWNALKDLISVLRTWNWLFVSLRGTQAPQWFSKVIVPLNSTNRGLCSGSVLYYAWSMAISVFRLMNLAMGSTNQCKSKNTIYIPSEAGMF